MFLIVLIFWIVLYGFNLMWGGMGFAMILLNPGTSSDVPDVAGQGGMEGDLAGTAWTIYPFFVVYFGFLGLCTHAFMPKGIRLIEHVFYRNEEDYRFPLWSRRLCCAYLMVLGPALFLFCPLWGPFFWLAVPFLNEGFSIPVTLLYYFVLTVLLVSPFWIYSRPR